MGIGGRFEGTFGVVPVGTLGVVLLFVVGTDGGLGKLSTEGTGGIPFGGGGIFPAVGMGLTSTTSGFFSG